MNNSTTMTLKQYVMWRWHRATSGNQTCLREQFVAIGCQELYFCSLYCLKDSVDSNIDPKKTPASHLLPDFKSIWWTWGQWGLQCLQPSLSPFRYKTLCKHICCFFIPMAPVRSSPKPCKSWHYCTCPNYILPLVFPIEDTGSWVVLLKGI